MAGSGKVQVQNNIANAKSPSNRSVYSGLNEIIPTMLRRRLFFFGQASAGSAIVLASNGVYASAWGPLFERRGGYSQSDPTLPEKRPD